jgi:hypothetical protein
MRILFDFERDVAPGVETHLLRLADPIAYHRSCASAQGGIMPPEYYFGIAVAAVLLVLLVSLVRGRQRAARPVVSSDTSQLAQQLSRIADSLEKLAVRLEASPPFVKQPAASLAPVPLPSPPVASTLLPSPPPASEPPAPVPAASAPVQKPSDEKAPEPVSAEPAKTEPAKSTEPAKPRVVLSMFGR